jgi:hypothetical protein
LAISCLVERADQQRRACRSPSETIIRRCWQHPGHVITGAGRWWAKQIVCRSATHPDFAIAIVSLNFPDEKAALAVVLCHLVIGTLAAVSYVR